MIVFRIQSINGDDRLTWDKRFIDQIKEARDKFYELVAKGYRAFSLKVDGTKKEELMTQFDPSVEEVLFVPPQQAG
jgi:predicted deacetylase